MSKPFGFKKILGLMFLAGVCSSGSGEPALVYSQAQFDLSLVSLRELGDLGLAVDHTEGPGSKFITVPVSPFDRQLLAEKKIPHKILVDDMAKWYSGRILKSKLEDATKEELEARQAAPTNFKLGTMGGYLTYAEINKDLDEMRKLFPTLVSAKIEIGKSLEGRSINVIRISNNPDVDQVKPRVWYDGLIHSREPMGSMNLMYYAWHLLESYATDPSVKTLVDNLEIYISPCSNPDGYEYNRSTNPTGGGMWRKNRSTNADGSRGVDPNRNFSVFWGNTVGASAQGSSDAYFGTSAFSEPETRAIRDFHLAKKFAIMLHYHTFQNKLIHPYGEGSYPTNRAEYEKIAKLLTAKTGWPFGPVPPMVGYSATGVTTDWAHDINKEFAFGAELGSTNDGFWPVQNRITPLAAIALDMNLALAKAVLPTSTPVAPNRKILPDFYANVDAAGGSLSFHYQLTDTKNNWYLTVHDLQGKQYQRYALTPAGKSVALPRSVSSGSLYLLEVKSCKGESCTSVYREKVTAGRL